MDDRIHLIPRDDQLDPLSLTSISEWVQRHRPHTKSRKKPRVDARAVASLLHWLWPGIDQLESPREIELSDPDAPFSVTVGEDRATVSVLRAPQEGEPRFVDTVVRAISQQTGWIGYDPARQDIIAGVDVHCSACERRFGVRHSHCPDCSAAASPSALTWVEPSAVVTLTDPCALPLAPLLSHYGMPSSALTDDFIATAEQALAQTVAEVLDARTAIEVQIYDPTTELHVMQCVTVVQTVEDSAREVAQDVVAAELDAEIGDELMFMLAITPDDQARAKVDDERYAFLPVTLAQPGLARPIWRALRPLLRGRSTASKSQQPQA